MKNDYIVESPVALIFTQRDGNPNALTISTFSEAAHFPTSLWVSIDKQSSSHQDLVVHPYFSLLILHDKQIDIARKCLQPDGRPIQPRPVLPIKTSPEGFYYIEEMLAVSFCKVRQIHALEKNSIFFGDILKGLVNTKRACRPHLLLSSLEK
jgi:flavin reductase (DIM6/NTAB) family NADH-FMN oxidoreductase RutF